MVPGEAWERCQVKAPAGAFKVVAQDESATGWFAFKAPAELGWLSWLADQTMPLAPLIFCSGLVLYAATLMVSLRSFPGPPEAGSRLQSLEIRRKLNR